MALFESADKDNSGAITFEELKAELETFPEVMENLTIRWSLTNTRAEFYQLKAAVLKLTSSLSFTLLSAANWLKPPDLDQKKEHHTPRYLTRAYWHNNSRKLLFLCSYAFFSLLLFISAMLQHRHGGGWFMLAKGCGQCLNFNCTFVVVAASAPSRSYFRSEFEMFIVGGAFRC